MNQRAKYAPGPASGARIDKGDGDWTLVLVRELRHAPAMVWEALADPAQLAEWAPFDADRKLDTVGPAKLSTFGAPQPYVTETTVKRAEPPRLLEYGWGGGDVRWELEATGSGTRLTLWANINRGYIAWGAAGWHVCFDVLDRLLSGEPIGRIAGPAAMQEEGWQRLATEYAEQFGVKNPSW